MRTVKLHHAQLHLEHLLSEVAQGGVLVSITQENTADGAVVLMRLRDYEGLLETLRQLASPRNSARLIKSIKQISNTTVQTTPRPIP